MTIYSAFLQSPQLVQFSGGITYNASGFAVLPSYSIITILASMQPASKANIRFNSEGTHYADWYEFLTDYPVNVDNSDNSLGDYFIYNNNVYKIISSQNFLPFSSLVPNHIEGMIVRDNRLTYNGTTLSLPFPEIDGQYGSLFQLIAMVNSCFNVNQPITSMTTLWSFQQELQPTFPYCTVTIEHVENIDNTNYNTYAVISGTTTSINNISKQLIVKFSFYALDQIQALNCMEQFKLNYVNFSLNSELFQWMGFVEGGDSVHNALYEDRTIFNADCRMRFSWIVQQSSTDPTTTNTIESVAFSLSIPPVI